MLTTSRWLSPDLSLVEVQNIQRWIRTIKDRMTLNLKKTLEMVVRGNAKTQIPEPMKDIERKEELKLLGVTFNELPCNWDTHFEHMISKATIMDKSPWDTNIHIVLSFLGCLIKHRIIFEIFLQSSLPPPYRKLKFGTNAYTRPTLFVGWGEGLALCELENALEMQVSQDFCP